MKKMFFIIPTGIALIAGLSMINAQSINPERINPISKDSIKNIGFVDNNNDGVCDHHSDRKANGHGRNFVDSNNDSVCDNYNTCNHHHQGQGRGNGNKHRHGWNN